ncbi:hypothetical protein E2C01_069078 [Portunus trituberculatus]|uniref:Uncharacterized protein n=1 Tax=Portunus trituberculatus TaxID=210409 RepID=A0A5B7I1U8_PORTR|nr:hypothetical protein [Portunus trituberculatus]
MCKAVTGERVVQHLRSRTVKIGTRHPRQPAPRHTASRSRGWDEAKHTRASLK